MKRLLSRLGAGVVTLAALMLGPWQLCDAGRALATNYHLRIIVGLATIDAVASPWSAAEYDNYSPNCDPGTWGWWHCDDGAGYPALDLNKGDGTSWETFGGCSVDQSVEISPGDYRCGTKVFFQGDNLSPSAPLNAVVFDHPSANGCSGVSVRLYDPNNPSVVLSRLEYVHMDEGAVNDSFSIGSGWTIYELGRVYFQDCAINSGAHLHQSAYPEGSVVTKNTSITTDCTAGNTCFISPTGDSTNKWMHDIFWSVPDLPDLVVTAAPSSSNPTEGSSSTFSVTVKNQGNAASGAFAVQLKFADQARPYPQGILQFWSWCGGNTILHDERGHDELLWRTDRCYRRLRPPSHREQRRQQYPLRRHTGCEAQSADQSRELSAFCGIRIHRPVEH